MICLYAVIIARMVFVPELLGFALYDALVYFSQLFRQLVIMCVFEFYIQRC